MKVLGLVSYPILPARIGGQKAIALFYKYFSREVPFICVTVGKNDPALAEGYTLLNILSDGPFRYFNPFYFFKLRRIIRRQGITHLELEHPYYGWLGVLLKWFTGIKLILHSYNIEGERFKTLGKWWWKLLWKYERWVHRQADYNFFITAEDEAYGIRQFGLLPRRCTVITYGLEWSAGPLAEERAAARAQVLSLHGIPAHHHLLLFNGAFNYLPNLNGLRAIMEQVNPALQGVANFPYTILVCGKDIPAVYSEAPPVNTIFAGFVPDIDLYFRGCDVFLNPLVEGGGIKTKLVEALGHGMNAVSSANGAIGIDPAICNGKLVITDDRLTGFPEEVVKAARYRAAMPADFFQQFFWGHIAKKAASFLSRR